MSDNAELIDIAGMVSEHPEEALGRLGAINRDSLAERDAYYHDFLTLKANDKAYIDHTTDSIILRLLPYYEGEPLYPEVLYYAGRVYSDLGDYPTSLRYFQEALDHIPADRKHLRLKGNILSQTGRLLNTLRMYDSAIPYLKEVIKMDEELADTFDIVYDNLLLGDIYIKNNSIDSAEYHIDKAYNSAQHLPNVHLANVRVYQAIIKKYLNNKREALNLIRGLLDKVHPLFKNAALINASDIYLENGIRDTAYIYAAELVGSKDINNIKNGYRNLLSADLIDFVPSDSLKIYIIRAYHQLNDYYNLNNVQQGIVQQSMYNYNLHDRNRAKAEQRTVQLLYIIIIIVLLIIIAIFIIIYRRKRLLLQLNTIAQKLAKLRSFLELDYEESEAFSLQAATEVEALRNYIKEQLEIIAKESSKDVNISPLILYSKAYCRINEVLQDGLCISDIADLWDELEAVVLEVSPDFYKKIERLSSRELDVSDRHLLLLIKSGFNHKQTAQLLSKAKGTISSRRSSLRNRIFGADFDLKYFDSIIRKL